MAIPFNGSAIPGRHTISYRIRDSHRGYPVRKVEVLATPEEIQRFVCDGYLVRERLLPPEVIEQCATALDECYARDPHVEKGGGREFGGVFLRHLQDKHPLFLEFLDFPPAVSVARALFGPSVQMRGFTARICFAEQTGQETEWHFHQRVVTDPLPPLLTRAHTMDVLIYLQETNDLNGPLAVVPGSHHWIEKDLDRAVFSDFPNQVVLRLAAGSMVLCHGALWHRAMPTRPGCATRRLLLFGYGPCWLKPSIYGVRPKEGLTARLLEQKDLSEETKELLGVSGYM